MIGSASSPTGEHADVDDDQIASSLFALNRDGKEKSSLPL
jgi:hypothetical protein